MAVKKPKPIHRQRLPEPEELFFDYVKRMARHREGRECIIVNMSRLEAHNRDRHHIDLVVMRVGQMTQDNDGEMFAFANGDVALVVHDVPPASIDDLLFDVRFSFSEDPLVQAEDDGEASFIDRFDIRWDYDEVEALARERQRKFMDVLKHQDTAILRDPNSEDHSDDQDFVDANSAVPSTDDKKPKLKAIQPEKHASLLDMDKRVSPRPRPQDANGVCLLYTSDAADD